MNTNGVIEKVADAVLYEGFLLNPYRLSSVKNQHRWNFGVVYPEPFGARIGEREAVQTECLVEVSPGAVMDVKVRFLYLEEGTPVDGEILEADLGVEELVDYPHGSCFSFGSVDGKLEVHACKIGENIFQVAVSVSNFGHFAGLDREEALARSLLSTHVILTARGGKFISLLDPPEALQSAARRCRNVGLCPVLIGRNDEQVLAAPIVLYDHPKIAPENAGELCGGSEIDQILALRIQTATEAEKEAMSTADGRTRALLEQSEALTPKELAKLHALRPRAGFKAGDRVRLRPRQRADIFDIALRGKLATVVAVERDLEERIYLCVTVDDDPGQDLGPEGKPGHRFFFSTDEVELV